MQEIVSLTQKGLGEVNEDIAGVSGDFAWIIDGATDVFLKNHLGFGHEVQEYVLLLNEKLKTLALDENYKTPHGLLYAAVKSLEAELSVPEDVPEYELPNFAVSMTRFTDDGVLLYVLGDCEIMAKGEYNEYHLRDHRIFPFSVYNKAEMRKRGINRNKDKEAARRIFCETRKKAGLPFPYGYPIGTVRGKCINEGEKFFFGSQSKVRVLMWSDGFKECLGENKNIDELFTGDSLRAFFDKTNDVTKDDRTVLLVG